MSPSATRGRRASGCQAGCGPGHAASAGERPGCRRRQHPGGRGGHDIQGPTGPLVLTLHRPIDAYGAAADALFLHGGGFTSATTRPSGPAAHPPRRRRRLPRRLGRLPLRARAPFVPASTTAGPASSGSSPTGGGSGPTSAGSGWAGPAPGGALAAAMACGRRNLGKPVPRCSSSSTRSSTSAAPSSTCGPATWGSRPGRRDAAPRVASLGATDVRGLAPAAFVLGAEDPWSRASLRVPVRACTPPGCRSRSTSTPAPPTGSTCSVSTRATPMPSTSRSAPSAGSSAEPHRSVQDGGREVADGSGSGGAPTREAEAAGAPKHVDEREALLDAARETLRSPATRA